MIARLLEAITSGMTELGLTWSILIAGVAGALISLISLDGPGVKMKLVTLFGGIALSWFGTPALGSYWGFTKIPVLAGIALVLGLYGLAVIKEFSDLIKSGALKNLITTFINLRGGPKS